MWQNFEKKSKKNIFLKMADFDPINPVCADGTHS